MSDPKSLVEFLAALVGTLLVGNEIAIAAFVHPSLERLDDLSHRRAARGIAAILGRWAPPWYIASILTLGAAAWLAHLPTLGIAAAMWLLATIFTIVLPAPLNARIAAWDPENPPEDWHTMRRRWDRWHLGRTLWLLVAQAIAIVALVH